MRLTYRVAVGLAALLMLMPLTVFGGTTGNLSGVVTDGSGAALPGVTVSVTSPQLQGTRTAVTNESGEYHLQLLPPGTYRVEFALAGMNSLVRDNIRVGLDQTTPLNVSMAMGAVTEAITVTAEAVVVDPTQTTVQQNFGEQHLKYATIGTAGRTYQTVLLQAPGVAGGSNPNVLGANLGQNNYMLDGVNTTDPVTHTFGSNLPFDAIQEVSVQMLGKDAEYGRAIGGVVNVVTKTGGNEFSGTFDARITNEDLAESGDHYDADTQDYREFKPAATLGGPIQRDKIWFFASAERPDNERVNPSRPGANWAPGARTFEGWNTLAKVTATLAANHTLAFRFTDNRADVGNASDSSFVRPEADRIQVQESTIYNLGYDAIINPQWLASVQVGVRRGFLESKPMVGDDNTIGVQNVTTSINWVNYTNHQGGDRDRDELIASTTYFFNGMGSHTFKVGLNLDQSEFSSFNNATGLGVDQSLCSTAFGQPAGATCGAIQLNTGGDVNNIGNPAQLNVSTIVPTETTSSDLSAYYIQDEWHPISPVTLRLGLRYETVEFGTPGTSAPELSKLQPRIGAAWDIFNNSNTVLHGFWGEVMDDNGLTLSSFLSTLGVVTSRFLPNGSGGWTFHSAIGGASGNQYDPDLNPTYGEEANLGITQRIWTNTSLDVTYVQRESKDIFEDSCEPVNCDFFWLTNNPNGLSDQLKSEYRGVLAKIESRPFSWLSGLVSYAYSESEGSIEYTQNAGTDFDVAPEHHLNRFGYLSDDARHRYKASGFVRAPWGTTFGFDYLYRTGLPVNTTATITTSANGNTRFLNPDGTVAHVGPGYGTLFLEPRGSNRTDDLQQLDMQVLHEFTFGRVRAGLVASVFNVLNSETALTLGSSIGNYGPCVATSRFCIDNPAFGISENRASHRQLGVSSASYGTETSWQRPRRYEVGVRFEF